MSHLPSRMLGKPLEHMCIDCIPIAGVMRGVTSCSSTDFLLLCDPISKFIDEVDNKTAAGTIEALTQWQGQMLEQGYDIFLYLCSDAGSNFTSDEF